MSAYIDAIQNCLDFKGCHGKQFDKDGLGKIGTTGFVLGLIGGIHYGIIFILMCLASEITFTTWIWALFIWSWYMSLLCTFHFLEFFSTAVNQPTNLSYQSLASWTEFWLEFLLFGRFKIQLWLAFLGIIVVILGQALRTVAMWQCGENFSHIIMDERTEVHQLVTTGVYKYFRHPSYVGWFYWSVGTQMILCNPVCIVLYAFASWSFFKDRIPYEEQLLLKFYKAEYLQYAKTTMLGIPYVNSPVDKLD